MKNSENLEKFLSLVSENEGNAIEKADLRIENRERMNAIIERQAKIQAKMDRLGIGFQSLSAALGIEEGTIRAAFKNPIEDEGIEVLSILETHLRKKEKELDAAILLVSLSGLGIGKIGFDRYEIKPKNGQRQYPKGYHNSNNQKPNQKANGKKRKK